MEQEIEDKILERILLKQSTTDGSVVLRIEQLTEEIEQLKDLLWRKK